MSLITIVCGGYLLAFALPMLVAFLFTDIYDE